jgi:F-type H+-transporting ATPase subunit b
MRTLLAALVLVLPAAARAEGMPQLDFANPLTTSQVVWGAIIFIVLYILASRFALPKVGAVLEERAAHIARDLEAARQAKLEADSAVAELTQATREAHAGAQAEIAQALETAKAAAAEQAAALNARLDAQIEAAEQRIGAARSAALGALGQVATDTAQAVVARLTGSAVDQGAVSRAVAAVLAARRPHAA